ncbi:MAG: hypothetical protein ABW041_00275 [Dehalococcoides mccartyi]|nr:hypothetical protein DMOBY_05930 [Dehalococcoides mccartyi]
MDKRDTIYTQVRFPKELLRKAKAEASLQGVTLQAYLADCVSQKINNRNYIGPT